MPRPETPETVFPDAVVGEIADEIGLGDPNRRRRLAQGLRDVAYHADSYRRAYGSRAYGTASPSARADALARLKAAYDQLLDCLQADPDFSLIWKIAAALNREDPNAAIGLAHERLAAHIKDLSAFRVAVASAQDDVERRITRGRGGARRKEDRALEFGAYMLSGVYRDVMGEEIKATRNGRGVRFLQLSLERLGWHKEPEQAFELIRTIKRRPPAHRKG